MSQPNAKKLWVEMVQDVTVVSFVENSILDASQISEISNELTHVLEGNRPRKLVLDFEQVRFLSSQALGMLITIQKKLDSEGGVMKIAGMRSELLKVFQITKLERLFRFQPSIDAAVADFGAPPQSQGHATTGS